MNAWHLSTEEPSPRRDSVSTPSVDADPGWLRRLALLGVGLPVAFIVLLQVLRPILFDQLWPRRGDLIVSGFTAAAAFAFGLVMFAAIRRGHQRMLESERHRATLAERVRIAREMHDSLAQVLSVAHLRLCATSARPELRDTSAQAELQDLAQVCHGAYADVRESILGLRQSATEDDSLLENLQTYVSSFSRQARIDTRLDVDADLDVLEPARAHLLRLIQEALTNVRKHAEAHTAVVRFTQDSRATTLTVEDDGRGFEPSPSTSGEGRYGLHAMRERADAMRADLTIDSRPGHGTRVVLTVPHTRGHRAAPARAARA